MFAGLAAAAAAVVADASLAPPSRIAPPAGFVGPSIADVVVLVVPAAESPTPLPMFAFPYRRASSSIDLRVHLPAPSGLHALAFPSFFPPQVALP